MNKQKDFPEEPEDPKKKKKIQKLPEFDEQAFLDALVARPFVELDNEFLLRKDFVIGLAKKNNFQEDKYSIVVYHEGLGDIPGMIWEKECFVSPSPKVRDENFNRLRVELNSL